MTRTAARQILAALGYTLRTVDGEHRVNASGAGEAMAFYTDCLQDAVDTARAEVERAELRAAHKPYSWTAPSGRSYHSVGR